MDFPIHALPKPAADLAQEAALSIGCPVDFLGAAVLPILGAALGDGITLQVKAGWFERPVVWVAIIGAPGTAKSPALSRLMRPVEYMQCQLIDVADEKRAQLIAESEEAKGREASSLLTQAEQLRADRLYVDDTTLEALAGVLQRNPNLLVRSDELAGWVKGWGQYKNGLGRDRQHWLSMWSSGAISLTRVRNGGNIDVPRPIVNVVGGIQPEILREIMSDALDGLPQRLLMAYGEPVDRRWTDAVETEAVTEAYDALWTTLYKRSKAATFPPQMRLGDGALAAFREFHDAAMTGEFNTPYRGLLEKMPAQAARIMLILASAENALTGENSWEVSEEAARNAIEITNYFIAQANKVASIELPGSQREQDYSAKLDQIAEWCNSRTTANRKDLLRNGPKWARKADEADRLLMDLCAADRLQRPLAYLNPARKES